MKTLALFCLVAAAFCVDEVTIDVFMESECPGCMSFVNNALKRALATPEIEKIAQIKIFPYGNARQTKNADGTWTFTCQHGPVECYGNTLEVCGMSRLKDSLDQLRYVQCIEENFHGSSTAAFDAAAQVCNPKFKLDNADINHCTNSNEGNQLHHQAGAVTDSLVPAHKYVPWIVANGQHDTTHEDSIQNDLVKWACTNYKGKERIAACGNYAIAADQ